MEGLSVRGRGVTHLFPWWDRRVTLLIGGVRRLMSYADYKELRGGGPGFFERGSVAPGEGYLKTSGGRVEGSFGGGMGFTKPAPCLDERERGAVH